MVEILFHTRGFTVDRTDQFRKEANQIQSKLRVRQQDLGEKSRSQNEKPSPAYTAIASILKSIAGDLYEFRKALTQLSVDVQSLAIRIANSDLLRNATERTQLTRVQEMLQTYLKGTADFVAMIKKEHLQRLQCRNRTVADVISEEQKNGYVFKFDKGLDAMFAEPRLKISDELYDGIKAIQRKYKCLQVEKKETKEEFYPERWDGETRRTSPQAIGGWEDDGWEHVAEQKPLLSELAPSAEGEERFDWGIRGAKVAEDTLRNRKHQHEKPKTSKFVEDPHGDDVDMQETYKLWRANQGDQVQEMLLKKCDDLRAEFDQQQDDEVVRLESQITEIQSLQETFAEKIMDQERDIDLINEMAMHTTENIVDGNEWIRKAISNSASRRVILLFCIVVMTLSLLFLDWYNP